MLSIITSLLDTELYKFIHANGQPVTKISDSPNKRLCDNPTFRAYFRQMFSTSA